MADTTDAEAQLVEAVTKLAKMAGDEDVATYALKYAAAANQLAEARAWLRTGAQPHGGFSYTDS